MQPGRDFSGCFFYRITRRECSSVIWMIFLPAGENKWKKGDADEGKPETFIFARARAKFADR